MDREKVRHPKFLFSNNANAKAPRLLAAPGRSLQGRDGRELCRCLGRASGSADNLAPRMLPPLRGQRASSPTRPASTSFPPPPLRHSYSLPCEIRRALGEHLRPRRGEEVDPDPAARQPRRAGPRMCPHSELSWLRRPLHHDAPHTGPPLRRHGFCVVEKDDANMRPGSPPTQNACSVCVVCWKDVFYCAYLILRLPLTLHELLETA